MSAKLAQNLAQIGPARERKTTSFQWEGRVWKLTLEPSGWRLRCRRRGNVINFRTGVFSIEAAVKVAKEHLQDRGKARAEKRKGGGTLATLTELYLAADKPVKPNVAADNVSRLRTICRVSLGRELKAVTCREVNRGLWRTYQEKALVAAGHRFDLVTRRRENIAINSAIRAARSIFVPALVAEYRAAGLDIPQDATLLRMLPEPDLPPSTVDDDALLTAWRALPRGPLWLTVGLARFAGLRREEIQSCQADWIEERQGVVTILMHDRPEQDFYTKRGQRYRTQVIDDELAAWLLESKKRGGLTVPDAADSDNRARWFEREPQKWLRTWIPKGKPLHRLRGLYADHIAELTADAVAARLAGVKAAQASLGHTTDATTRKHYLSREE